MNYWTSDRPHYHGHHELAKFEALNTPLWIFDVSRHAMWWANPRALAFWHVDNLEALLIRDYSTDSESVRTRLRQIVEQPRGSGRIQETWTLYPDETPVTVIVDIQPTLIGDGRHAIMVEASRKLEFKEDPEALRMLEAARSSALMVSSFTMDGYLLSQNPASHACYAKATETSGRTDLASRFTDDNLSTAILSAVDQAGQFDAEVSVRTGEGERIHRVMARKGRDPVTGSFIMVLNEEDMTEQVTLRRDLQRLNSELETRVAERTERLQALNESLSHEIEERQAAEEKLRRAHRMEAVGQLTGGVAHDFNNLLAVILGNTDLLEDDHGKHDQSITAIRQAAVRGAELTQLLLAFSRKQPLRPRAVTIGDLVQGMISLLHRTLGETIEIQTRAAPDQWDAMADPGQIENVVLNLALNARDAMPTGGTLTIESANLHLDESDLADVDELVPGDYVVLQIRDTGTGMSPKTTAHAFEPFFTTKEVGQGSGLGLSMVYGFAKQSGGHVSIASEEGHGTTIKLFLPRAKTVPSQPAVKTETGMPRGKGETILVIEDDSGVLDLAVTMLERLGYRVMAAGSVPEARKMLTDGTAIRLVFSDVVLPGGISGPEFVRDLRTHHPDIKVVFRSGYPAETVSADNAVQAGDVLLSKPFRIRQVADAMHTALA